MARCECGKEYIDEHGHGLCFGCKIKGIRFGSVRQGPSKWALEKEQVDAAKAKGIQIGRVDDTFTDRREKPLPKLKRTPKLEAIARAG